MKTIKKVEKALIIFHIFIIILAWTSPFWLDWKVVSFFVVLYYIQLIIFKGCILTNLQFNKNIKISTELTMYSFIAEKLGYNLNRAKLKFYSDYIMPMIILIIAITWQVLLNRITII